MDLFLLFPKAMYDSYLWQIIESVPLHPQEPVNLYQSEDIERLRICVNKLESDVTSLTAENTRYALMHKWYSELHISRTTFIWIL